MTKKIAVYNSLPCHYEMFGYIIFYCLVNNFTIEIFTEKFFNMDWLLFYKKIFQNYNITYKNYSDFENYETRKNFDLIFITTDDDPGFKYEWMNNKVICINHYYICRRIDYYHCIGVRPFKKSQIKWGLPCFPVMDKSNKHFDPHIVHVCIIGGGNLETNLYNINVINRLKSDKKIMIHAITRFVTHKMVDILKKKNDNIDIKLYQHMSTESMFSLLVLSNYMLTDVTMNNDHKAGYSMTGSVPLAFSSLSRLIISSHNNKMYKFYSALEFDAISEDDIFLDSNTNDMMDLMISERSELINMFHKNVNDILYTI
jgi:hypothetical protein